MRVYLGLCLLTATAMVFTACPESATNTNTENTNAANENVAAAPEVDPKDAVVELETKAYEAWKAKDGKYFEGMLADDFVSNGVNSDKAGIVKSINESPCEVKDVKLEDPQTINLTKEAVLLTHKVVADFTCDGKPGLSPTWAASVFVKKGDEWKGAFHQSLPATDAKGEGNPASKPATLANADDELTKTLSEMENKWWEEWKAKKTNYFEEATSSDFVMLSAAGRRDKPTSLKESKETPCEVKSFNLEGFKAKEIAENVAVLTYFATQDAKCGEDAVADKVFSSSIFVKDGDTWKGAFYTETPAA